MATIVYEGPNGVEEHEVDKGELKLNSGGRHWAFPVGENHNGRTVSKIVPCERVYHVEKVAPLRRALGD